MTATMRCEGCSPFFRSHAPLMWSAVLACAMPLAVQEARAQSGERSGKEVVAARCAQCHETGEQSPQSSNVCDAQGTACSWGTDSPALKP